MNDTNSPVFTDEDISAIIQSNLSSEELSVLPSPPQEEEHIESEETNEEESAYDENQGEGDDDLDDLDALLYGDNEDNDNSSDGSSSSESSSHEPPREMLPVNSSSLLVDESTTRFSGAEWFQAIQNARVIIAGVGGIGSNLAFQIARMSPASITLYDNDSVEKVNMAGQLFGYNDIGTFKTDAISRMIRSYTSTSNIYAVNSLFTSSSPSGDIMMCGFDSMNARETFFLSWLQHLKTKSSEEKAQCLFLDGRLSMDTLQVFCLRGDDDANIYRYNKEFIFPDSQADATVCSMKQTTYLACMIGSLMTNLFTNFIAGTLNPIIPYDLPFFTEYDAQHMIFKTEY